MPWAGCGQGSTRPTPPFPLRACCMQVPGISVFAQAMDQAGLLGLLGSPTGDGQNFTVFAPRRALCTRPPLRCTQHPAVLPSEGALRQAAAWLGAEQHSAACFSRKRRRHSALLQARPEGLHRSKLRAKVDKLCTASRRLAFAARCALCSDDAFQSMFRALGISASDLFQSDLLVAILLHHIGLGECHLLSSARCMGSPLCDAGAGASSVRCNHTPLRCSNWCCVSTSPSSTARWRCSRQDASRALPPQRLLHPILLHHAMRRCLHPGLPGGAGLCPGPHRLALRIQHPARGQPEQGADLRRAATSGHAGEGGRPLPWGPPVSKGRRSGGARLAGQPLAYTWMGRLEGTSTSRAPGRAALDAPAAAMRTEGHWQRAVLGTELHGAPLARARPTCG